MSESGWGRKGSVVAGITLLLLLGLFVGWASGAIWGEPSGLSVDPIAQGEGQEPVTPAETQPDELAEAAAAKRHRIDSQAVEDKVAAKQQAWASGIVREHGTKSPLAGCRFLIHAAADGISAEDRLEAQDPLEPQDSPEAQIGSGVTGTKGEWSIPAQDPDDSSAKPRGFITFLPHEHIRLKFSLKPATGQILEVPKMAKIEINRFGGPKSIEWWHTVHPMIMTKEGWEVGRWRQLREDLGCAVSVDVVNGCHPYAVETGEFWGIDGLHYAVNIYVPGFETSPGQPVVTAPARLNFTVGEREKDAILIIIEDQNGEIDKFAAGWFWALWGYRRRSLLPFHRGVGTVYLKKDKTAPIPLRGKDGAVTVRLESGKIITKPVDWRTVKEIRVSITDGADPITVKTGRKVACGFVRRNSAAIEPLSIDPWSSARGEGILHVTTNSCTIQPGPKAWDTVWLVAKDGSIAIVKPEDSGKEVTFSQRAKVEVDLAILWALPSGDFKANLFLEIRASSAGKPTHWQVFQRLTVTSPQRLTVSVSEDIPGVEYKISGALIVGGKDSSLDPRPIR